MELPHLLLTSVSLEFWGQFLLTSLLLALVVYWQISLHDTSSDRKTHYLAITLGLYLSDAALLTLSAGALYIEQVFWNALLFPSVALTVFVFAQFVYRMPDLPDAWRREERLCTLLLLGAAVWEVGFGAFRLAALARGEVYYRPWGMSFAMLLAMAWLASVLLRQVLRTQPPGGALKAWFGMAAAAQTHDVKAARAFLVAMAFLLTLSVVNVFQSWLQLSSNAVYYLSSLLSTAALITVVLAYVNHYALKASFVIQITSITIMLTVLIISTAGRAVTNTLVASLEDAALTTPARSIRFTPLATDAYQTDAYQIDVLPAAGASTIAMPVQPPGRPTLPQEAETVRVDLPFAFPFFGRLWSVIYLHPAGFLTFGEPQTLANLGFRYGTAPAIFALYRTGAAARHTPAGQTYMTVAATDAQVRIRWEQGAAPIDPDGVHGADAETTGAVLQVVLKAGGVFEIEHPRVEPVRSTSPALVGGAWQQWVGAHNGDITQAPPGEGWPTLNGRTVAMTQTLVVNNEIAVREWVHPILKQLMLLMLVGVLMAVGAVPLFLRAGFMLPLQRLLLGIERVRRGDLTGQIPVYQNSEIGVITEAFNELVATQRVLLENLESQVQERTQRLGETNRELQQEIELHRKTQLALEQLNHELDTRVQARTQELAQSEERFRRVVTSISDHVYAYTINLTTGDRTIEFLSPNLRDFVMFDTEKINELAYDWRENFVAPEDVEIYDQHTANLLAGRDSQVEYRLRRADGHRLWVRASVRTERLSATEIRCYGVMSNLTARKQLEQETATRQALQEIELLRSEWLGNMSHELRTPLGLIKTAATTLLAKDITIPPPMQQEILERLDQETDRLTDLVDTLLDLSRLEAARLRLNYAQTDVAAMLQELADTVLLQMRLGSLPPFQVTVTTETTPLYATLDRERMKRVVQNLLSNAMKFSPHHSPLTIDARIEDAHLVITVIDCGIGIDAADYEHIFERYYQVKQTGVNSQPGVGLGLPISREIVRAHGGEITVNSQRAGKHRKSGTTFIVRVPTAPTGVESAPF